MLGWMVSNTRGALYERTREWEDVLSSARAVRVRMVFPMRNHALPGISSLPVELVLGVLSARHNIRHRHRLRSHYQKSASSVVVRFVVDWSGNNDSSWLLPDEVLVPRMVAASTSNMCIKRQVMARLSAWWWRAAERWPARFYGKTDDDAVIDLQMLPALLRPIPAGPSLAGAVRYSCLNTTTHSCKSPCHALGAVSALRLRTTCACGCDFGPFPFVLGPLIMMSSELRTWVVPLVNVSTASPCPASEDVLMGSILARHPYISMVDLSGALGNFDVLWSPTRWAGPPSLLAHHVYSDEVFYLAVRDFRVATATHDGFNRYCAASISMGKQRHRRARKKFCEQNGISMHFRCVPWSAEFPRLAEFPCCTKWTYCETPPPLPFASRFRRNFTFSASLPAVI